MNPNIMLLGLVPCSVVLIGFLFRKILVTNLLLIRHHRVWCVVYGSPEPPHRMESVCVRGNQHEIFDGKFYCLRPKIHRVLVV